MKGYKSGVVSNVQLIDEDPAKVPVPLKAAAKRRGATIR
jgi:hypothetical protein